MAAPVQLSELVRRLRAEAGHSLNVAHGIQGEETLKYMLDRIEEELYVGYDWNFKRANREILLHSGDRYYDYPVDMPFDQVNQIFVNDSNNFLPLDFGLTPEYYNTYSSDSGEVSWPPLRWDHNPDTKQIEVWPLPNRDGALTLRGTIERTPMVSNTDYCTLDPTLLVLFASVELLARVDSRESELKFQKAQRHLQRTMAQQGSQKRRNIRLAPKRGPSKVPVRFLDYIPS